MTRGIGARHLFTPFACYPLSRKILGRAALIAAGALLSSFAGVSTLDMPPVTPEVARRPVTESAPTLASNPFGAVLVELRSHAMPVSIARGLSPEPELASIAPSAAVAEPGEEASSEPTPAVPELAPEAPLPPRRPAEFGPLASRPGGDFAQKNTRAAPAAAPADDRTIFDKLFGAFQSSEPKTALAYAAPEGGLLDNARKSATGSFGYDRWTAVYDISAHTVYLPDGTKLEAHSGLGDKLDDPHHVHVRMRGATPPHLYELSLRERPFHGVKALRLTPIGGERSIFGRAGLLAHTYMLGPRGDSNGCVSFRNYDAFLRAFQSGEIKRLAVVARLS